MRCVLKSFVYLRRELNVIRAAVLGRIDVFQFLFFITPY